MHRHLLVIGIIAMIIGMGVLPSTAFNVEKKPSLLPYTYSKTLYVGGSGPGNYTSIQDGINNASDNDTVFVFDDSSPYYENVVVNKSINLIGEDKDTTIIDSLGYDDAVHIAADFVNLTGFAIYNDNYRTGIDIRSNYCKISDNFISNTFGGILLQCSNNNTIMDNIIDSNKGHGICLDESNNNLITDNTILSNLWDGICFYKSNNNRIISNIISKNSDGIVLWSSRSNKLSGNTISNNDHGIILAPYSLLSPPYCIYNVISDNDIDANNDHGIYLWNSYCNTITGNSITNNDDDGIHFRNSSGNKIRDNNITLNNNYGINFHSNSSNNNIYHNNLLENSMNAYDDCSNLWDDGKYGNYWGDYEERYPKAKRLWLKGIWGTPYHIQGGDNNDLYPLVKQWPKSLSNTVSRSKVSASSLYQWFIERFLLL